jgi:hypothetical protein
MSSWDKFKDHMFILHHPKNIFDSRSNITMISLKTIHSFYSLLKYIWFKIKWGLPMRHVVGCCRCFGSDRAPGVAPRGAFWSRTVLSTVARWFVLNARETVDSCVQVWAALRCVIPYVLV